MKTQHRKAKEWMLTGFGLVFLIAFLSYWWQIELLTGELGILPIVERMQELKEYYGSRRFLQFPTLSWFFNGTTILHAQCFLGLVFSICLLLRKIPVVSFVLLWFLYLSISTAGQIFYYFQWDILLLEATLLCVVCYIGFKKNQINNWGLWLIWLLIFKLMFLSGAVKLMSGDSSWKDGSALTFHYFTQPLPNGLSYYFHHLPLAIHKLSAILMFAIELVVPFFILIGGLMKQFRIKEGWAGALHRFSAWAIILLMLVIILSGNYNFFNLLVMVLCLSLFDDETFFYNKPNVQPEVVTQAMKTWKQICLGCTFFFLIIMSAHQFRIAIVGQKVGSENILTKISNRIAPFKSVNSYGLFRVMTKTRPEVIFEGSLDGVEWKAYTFKWKVGQFNKRPQQAAPYHPRLDWQLWFAALGSIDYNPWVYRIIRQMLEGSPMLERYIEENPFKTSPPIYVRSRLFDYEFEEKGQSNWWKRVYVREYTRPLRLEDYKQ